MRNFIEQKLAASRVAPRHLVGAAIILSLGILPLAMTSPQLRIMIGVVYLMVFAMTWDVASGYTGQLNFGHAFFIAVGGYTTAILNVTHGYSPLISISAAIVVSAVAGLVVGIPALRLKGAYLALVTFVAPFIFYQIVLLRDDIFMGSFGFRREPTAFAGLRDGIVTVQSSAMATIIDYYVAYALLVIIFLVLYTYTRSPAGPILTAIREDEKAVAAVGLNPAKYKVFAFLLSAATGGLAGAMFVHSSVGFPQPDELLVVQLSLDVIIVSIIGGMGTIIGALVGALLFGGLEFVFERNELVGDIMPLPLFVLGAVVVYFEPRGLVPWVVEYGRSLRSDEETKEQAEEPSPVEQTFDRYLQQFRKITRGK